MRFSRTFTRSLIMSALFGTLLACGDGANIAVDGQDVASHAALGAECNLEGTWAMKITIPVSWSANIGVQGGQGEIVQWARTERKRDTNNTVVDTLVPCGSVIPDYKSQAIFKSETYGTRFPDSLFDNVTQPATEVRTTVGSFAVGGTFQSGFAPIQLGVHMNDPLNDAWPAKSNGLTSVIDGDKDGHPGVTLVADSGPGYSNPPTNMFGTKRANRFFVAVRNVAATTGKIDSCERLSGKAEIPTIGGRPALNSHVLGCERVDGTTCSQAEADMLDRFQPYYVPGESTATVVRVDSNTTCQQIRALQF